MLYNIPIDNGWISDKLLRKLIQSRLNKYHQNISQLTKTQIHEKQELFCQYGSTGPIAINTIEANQQHYEVPAKFFKSILYRT